MGSEEMSDQDTKAPYTPPKGCYIPGEGDPRQFPDSATVSELLVADLKAARMTKLELSKALGISPQAITNWSYRNYIPAKHVSSILTALKEIGKNGRVARALADGTLDFLEENALKRQSLANNIARGASLLPHTHKQNQTIQQVFEPESQYKTHTGRNKQSTHSEMMPERRRLIEIEIREDSINAMLTVEEDFPGFQPAFNFASAADRWNTTRRRVGDGFKSSEVRNWFLSESLVADIFELPISMANKDQQFLPLELGRFRETLLNLLITSLNTNRKKIQKRILFAIFRSELYNLKKEQKEAELYLDWIKKNFIDTIGENFIDLIIVPSLTDAVIKTIEINQSLTTRV